MTVVDTIFRGGAIITMDESHPAADAVAVAAGKIIKVGTDAEVMALKTAETTVVDLAGSTLLPGFVEAHGHPLISALGWGDPVIDIRALHTPTYEAAMAKIGRRVQKAAPGEFIMAMGLDPTLHEGMREPSLHELDALAPDNPLMITLFNFHGSYLNSKAVEICGFNKSDPAHIEEQIVRDPHGRPWKLKEEMNYQAKERFYEACGKERALEALHEWIDKFTAAGYTTTAEIGVLPQWMGYFDALRKKAELPIRFRVYEQVFLDTPFGTSVGDGDDRFRCIGAKLWADGSLFVGNTAMTRPYLSTEMTLKRMGMPTDNRGSMNYSRDVLTKMMEKAIEFGWQLAVHSQGDATIDMVLDVYEDILSRLKATNGPHRLEHCTMMRPDQAERAHRLGLVCSFFNTIGYYWGDAMRTDMFGNERGDAILPFGTAIAAGMRVSYHCDAPMTWPTPLLCVYFAVTRKTQSGQVLAGDTCVSIAKALRGVTIDAAYQLQMDHLVGSISVGKRADFVRLDKNPLGCAPEELKEINVISTYIDGKCASGQA